MPQALPFIASAAASWAGATAVQAAVISLITSLVVADYQRGKAQDRARAAAEQSARERTISIRSGVAPCKLVLGTARISGPFMHADFIGSKKEYYDQVLALCRHEVEFLAVHLDDETIPIAAFAGGEFPTTGRYASSTAPVQRESAAGTVSGATSYTLPDTPVPGTDIVAIIGTSGDSATTTYVGVTGVSGNTISFGEALTGLLTVQYSVAPATAAKLRILFNTGTTSQSALLFGDVSSPLWTSAHRLRGVASLRALMRVEDPAYSTGVPNLSATARGPIGVVWDPRTSAYLHHTTNPALLSAWFRTLPEVDGGMGIPTDWIDWASVAAAANVCDELISVKKFDNSGYENIKRYECNTVLSLDRSPVDNLQTILLAMAGDFPFTGGQYRCFAGAFRSATVTVGDNMVASANAITIGPTTGGDTVPPNIVTAQFYDAAKSGAQTDAPAVENATYITADGEESVAAYELDATTDARQANYLQGVFLERGRPALALSLGVAGIGANIALMDTLQFNMQGYEAIAGKTFEVRRRTNHWNGRYSLDLREVRASTYALDADRFTPVTPPAVADNTHLWSVAAPTSLAATAAAIQRQSDGTVLNTATVTWALHPADSVQQGGAILLRWRRAVGEWIYLAPVAGSATTQEIAGLPASQAVFIEAAARNSLGAQSAWVGVGYQVEKMQLRGNLLDGGQWVPGTTGTQGVAPKRFAATGSSGENAIVLAAGPDGQVQPLWQCTSVDATSGGTADDGGWNTDLFPVDHTKQYFFGQLFQCLGTMDGGAYLGVGSATVRDIGVAINANPYFVVASRSSLIVGKYYLMGGYVLPSTYSGAQLYMSGLWDAVTGEKLAAGTDYQWVSGQTNTYQRSYLVYGSSGAVQRMAPPLVYLCDGTEPSIAQILSTTAKNTAWVQIFKRTTTSTPPALPSATVTYTYATGVAAGLDGGWEQALPTTGGEYRWTSSAPAISHTASDTITPAEWAAVALLATDGAPGTDGTDGTDGADAVSSGADISAITLPADSLGVVNAGALPVTVTAYAKLGAAADTVNWTWSRTSTSGITTTISGAAVTLTAMASGLDSGTITITGTKAGAANITVTITVAKAKASLPATGPRDFAGYTGAVRFATGTPAVAEMRVNSSGAVERRINGGSWSSVGVWFQGTVSGTYSIKATSTGSALSSGTLNAWVAVSGSPVWAVSQPVISPAGEKNTDLVFAVRNDSSDLVVATGTWNLNAVYEA